MTRGTENFYVKTKDHWLKFFNDIIKNKKVEQLVLQKYIESEKLQEMILKFREKFEELLPQIPDFGNKRIGPATTDMVKTVLSFAFYRILIEEKYEIRTIGQIIYEISDAYYRSLNPITKFLMRRPYFSTFIQKKAKKLLEIRKMTEAPEDYHYTYIEGDQKNLLFGVDITNCGGLYFLKQNNALEIAPYLCLCDYPMYKGIKIGFNRAENLAIGGSKCAFRFYKNYPEQSGWPPEQLEEYKNFKFR